MTEAQKKSNKQNVVSLRDSKPADVPAIRRIYAHHVEHSFSSFEEAPPSEPEMATRRQGVLDKGWPHIVAELDGNVVGFAYVAAFRPRSAYRYTVEDSIYVDPDTTRRGVGSALMGALITRAEALGCRQMVAVIGGSDNAPSINLHERFGFKRAATLNATGFKFGRWADTVIMQRAIGPGDEALPE